MRESRLWFGLVGGFALILLWALSLDDLPNDTAPAARVAAASAPNSPRQAAASRSLAASAPTHAASAAPAPDTPVCDPSAADSKPSDAVDTKVLQDLDAALAARGSERAEAVRLFVAAFGGDIENAGVDTQAIDGLARMAVRTLDPAIYAISLQACVKRQGGCQMISARQWARLDPLNAMAWLHVVAESAAERNEAGVAEAMYQVSRSTRSDAYEGMLMREVLGALPKELTPQAHGPLATRLIGVEAAWVLPGIGTAQAHCSNIATRDANRRQLCSEVADTLLRRSNSFVEQSVGIAIGRRSGWAAEKIEAAGTEREALMFVMRRHVVPADPNPQPNVCESGALAIQALRQLAERGEVGSARDALRRSGKSVAEWVAAARAERERAAQRARADRAASAAAPRPGV